MSFPESLIEPLVKKYAPLGARDLPNGARLVGHVPHVAPEAYFVSAFPGLGKGALDELEAEVGRKLPAELRAFYARYNGLDLFASSLAVTGLRDPFLDGDAGSVGQPFSAGTQNTDERPPGAPADAVFFAAYEWDGSVLYAVSSSKKIVRCSRDDATPLNTWPSLDAALTAEVKRIGALFDDRGVKRDEDAPTAPDPIA